MRVNNVSSFRNSVQSVRNNQKSQSFGAKIFFYKNVKPYLSQQGYNMSLTEGLSAAQQWVNRTWENINKVCDRVSTVLNPDTPIVLAASDEACKVVSNSKTVYKGLDGLFVLDGKPIIIPGGLGHTTDLLEQARIPFKFQFSPDEKIADNAINYFNQIPREIANYFKPWF